MASSKPDQGVSSDGAFEMTDNKVAQFKVGEKAPSKEELDNAPEVEGTRSTPDVSFTGYNTLR